MLAVRIYFFERHGCKYLLLMDHFSGVPMFANMGYGTDTDHKVRQLKRWFATFGVSRSIRCDKGPPFSRKGFQDFCDEHCIDLQLTSPYNPESSGSAESSLCISFSKAVLLLVSKLSKCILHH